MLKIKQINFVNIKTLELEAQEKEEINVNG